MRPCRTLRVFTRLLPLLCLLLVAACAPIQPQLPQPEPPAPREEAEDEATAVWRRFTQRCATAEIMSGPFRISGTLRYTDPQGKSNRVSSLLWGNNQADNPWPLRLDLSAGVGQVVAKAREDKNSFVAFIPDENTAYEHRGDSRTLASFGVPVPLSLGDLALLLTGRGALLFLSGPNPCETPVPAERRPSAEGALFTIGGARLNGELELSAKGAPLRWREAVKNGWVLEFEASADNPLRPEKIRVKHGKGWNALINVREIARVSPPFSADNLALPLPPGTEKRPLEH